MQEPPRNLRIAAKFHISFGGVTEASEDPSADRTSGSNVPNRVAPVYSAHGMDGEGEVDPTGETSS